ncbi:hypothetical protein HNY73_013970 [Argiope bruennichi]|uniref:Uncharacterized protein n=1 Tax=Argiope bruennichi TaxID=94029 RepID=A0A8T0EP50_ARGBR|nr:hypothetical protein HNY73_013970 [Argiope bruennichi]
MGLYVHICSKRPPFLKILMEISLEPSLPPGCNVPILVSSARCLGSCPVSGLKPFLVPARVPFLCEEEGIDWMLMCRLEFPRIHRGKYQRTRRIPSWSPVAAVIPEIMSVKGFRSRNNGMASAIKPDEDKAND